MSTTPANTTQTNNSNNANTTIVTAEIPQNETPNIETPTTPDRAQNAPANSNNMEAAMITPGNGTPPQTNTTGNQTITITDTPTGTNNTNMHHSHHNTTTYNLNFPDARTDGPLTRACRIMGANGNPMLGARLSQQVFDGMFTPESACTPESRILLFGEQPALFPLLAVIKPDNKVMVLHGIKRLGVAFGIQHPNTGHTLAFCNDAANESDLPPLLKLTTNDFAATQAWFCPDLVKIMNTDTTHTTVLPVPDGDSITNTAKIIPIPLFLVPLFINGGTPRNATATFQAFYDDFYEKAPNEMKNQTQYILNFLHAAAGFDVSSPDTNSPPSQLALETETLTWDPILYQWALNRFGGIMQLARFTGQPGTAPAHNQASTHPMPNATTVAIAAATAPLDTNPTPNQNNTNTMATVGQTIPGQGANGQESAPNDNQNTNPNMPGPNKNRNYKTTQNTNGFPGPTNINQIQHLRNLHNSWQNQNQQINALHNINPHHTHGQQTNHSLLWMQANNTHENSFPQFPNYGLPRGLPSQNDQNQNPTQPYTNINMLQNHNVSNIPGFPRHPQGAGHTHNPNQNQPFIQFFPGLTAHQQNQQTQQSGQTTHVQQQSIDPNLASIISGAFQAAMASMQQQQGTGSTTGGLHTSGKSVKILNGTNRFSLLGFCGLTLQDEVPDIFKILDSNDDPTAKFQALEDLLLMAQHGNALINFTL